MIEENYLSYPQAVKEAIGLKVDYPGGSSETVDIIIKDSIIGWDYNYELTPRFNSINSTYLLRITLDVFLSGNVSLNLESLLIPAGEYECSYTANELKQRIYIELPDFEGVSILIDTESWTDPETGDVFPSTAKFIREISSGHGLEPFGPSIGGGGSGGGLPGKVQNP